MPDGYPDRAEAWTPSLLARWNLALDLARGKVPGTQVEAQALVKATGQKEPLEQVRALSRAVLGVALPEAQLTAFAALARAGRRGTDTEAVQQWLALLLASPQFQWR
jgi:hypothetical protein